MGEREGWSDRERERERGGILDMLFVLDLRLTSVTTQFSFHPLPTARLALSLFLDSVSLYLPLILFLVIVKSPTPYLK